MIPDDVIEQVRESADHLRIIHGKGTGVLRDFVHATLKRDPRIKRFVFAPSNQGGQGVTVAEFA